LADGETDQSEVAGRSFVSFAVVVCRAFKTFPQTSQEINQVIGARVKLASGAKVDLSNPDLTVYIEVLPDEAFIYFEKIQGPGGLPVGVSGTVVCLLSGGIDSPVAAYRMMKRGCRVVFVHFHSQPFADRTSQEKATELARLLTRYQYASRLYVVPFGETQQEVVARTAGRFRVLVYRRLMLRMAEEIARKEGAQALVTGESLGQVSSQTLENIAAIEEAATLPILRPLVGMDKEEITHQARQIGSYETSTIPDQDCCSMFAPRQVVTRATDDEVSLTERTLDLKPLVQRALSRGATRRVVVSPLSSRRGQVLLLSMATYLAVTLHGGLGIERINATTSQTSLSLSWLPKGAISGLNPTAGPPSLMTLNSSASDFLLMTAQSV
jgi:thiamine biosynthesis protein ThiI